jgi:hypothetical protein
MKPKSLIGLLMLGAVFLFAGAGVSCASAPATQPVPAQQSPDGIHLKTVTNVAGASNDTFLIGTIGAGDRRERFIIGPLPRDQGGELPPREPVLNLVLVPGLGTPGLVEPQITSGFFIYVAGAHGRARSTRVAAAATSTKFIIVAPDGVNEAHLLHNVSNSDTGSDENPGNGVFDWAWLFNNSPVGAYQSGPSAGKSIAVDQHGNWSDPDRVVLGESTTVRNTILAIVKAINDTEYGQPAGVVRPGR